MTEKQLPWPYNLPIWRSFYRATSPDGRRVAQIDPALEMGMSNPTSGLLCVTSGPHIERCSPSFVWSDDSRYLAVPQFSGFLGRARLLVVSFGREARIRFQNHGLALSARNVFRWTASRQG